MPRYHFHAARREAAAADDPLVLDLTGEAEDGTSLPEFPDEVFPRTMPAAVQLLMLEVAVAATERSDAPMLDDIPDEEKLRLGVAVLREAVGLDRVRKWMSAGYSTDKLMELVTVLVHFWQTGSFPNSSTPTAPLPPGTLPIPDQSRRGWPTNGASSHGGPARSISGPTSRRTSSGSTGSTSPRRSGGTG